MNLAKFGSLNLDTPSSRYKFLKFAIKSRKTNKNKSLKPWLIARTRGSTGPTCQWHRSRGRRLTGDCSPTVRSPAVGSPPLDSTRRTASNGVLSLLRGLSEQVRRWPWWMTALHDGAPVVSDLGKPAWARFRLHRTLRKIGLGSGATVERRWSSAVCMAVRRREHGSGKLWSGAGVPALARRAMMWASMAYGVDETIERERSERLWLRLATMSSKLCSAPVSMATASAHGLYLGLTTAASGWRCRAGHGKVAS
jgi:hypothetical protein